MSEQTRKFERVAIGAAEIVNEEELKALLESGKQLTVKLGLDPTAPDIHLGHAVVLRKLKHFQMLGHKAVIIIGDFTAQIGDPTGKSKTRSPLTQEQVLQNAETYKQQIFKILDPNLTEVRFNSEWLNKLNFSDVVGLASRFTLARMLERDDFKRRFKNEIPIGLHEFFYPIMQAYDSIAIDADVEIGGNDQRFNILMGRTLQDSMNKKKQVALFMPLLVGLDGIEKMSKSLNNSIGISELPEDIFGKIMSLSDDLVVQFFELCTDIESAELKKLIRQKENFSLHPKEFKMILAKEVVSLYHSAPQAILAQDHFERVFSKKEVPLILPELEISVKGFLETIESTGVVSTRTEIRRLIIGGGVRVNGEKVDIANLPCLKSGDVLKVGKKNFYKCV